MFATRIEEWAEGDAVVVVVVVVGREGCEQYLSLRKGAGTDDKHNYAASHEIRYGAQRLTYGPVHRDGRPLSAMKHHQ